MTKNNKTTVLPPQLEEPDLTNLCVKMQSNLQDAVALSRKLEKVLEGAHLHMLNRDMPQLEDSLATQMKLLNLLQVNGALRGHYLSQLHCSGDRKGIITFFTHVKSLLGEKMNTLVNYSVMHQFWEQLEETAIRCQQLNHANGRLLARLAANTRKMCEMVIAGQLSATYDKRGLMMGPLEE